VNRTTKILLAVGGVIVLSYPGIAWVSGMVIESRIQNTEQRMLDQVPYFTLVKREYHRGVYRSTQIATYAFRSPALPAAGAATLPSGATITVESEIRHGPFPGLRAPALAIVDSTLVTPPALQTELGSKSILQAHTVVGLFGAATTNLTSPAWSVRLADGSTLTWGGLTGTVTTDRRQARWAGQLTAPRLAFAGAQGGIELAGMEYSGSHEKAFDDLYLGSGTFTIERLDGSSSRSGDYSLQRLSITSTSKADGEFFDMRVDAGVDAATIAAMQLKSLVYSESFEHVHGPTFASMMQAIRAAQHQAGANPKQLQAGIQDAVRQYGADLLLHDPVLDIRQVSFAMPEGSFLLSAKISAPGLSRADLQWPAAILALKTHAAVTADLRVDNGLVQKLLSMGGSNPRVGAQLTSFEQQGYLTAGSAAVTTHLEYSGGRLTLNGHPFPPAPPGN
jgi:uncharacterized protein YdgA (DUF945 family)